MKQSGERLWSPWNDIRTTKKNLKKILIMSSWVTFDPNYWNEKQKADLFSWRTTCLLRWLFSFFSSYLVFPEGQGRLMLVQVLLNELMNLQHCQFFTPEGMPLHEAMSLQKCIHCDSAIFISEIAERDTSLEQIHWYP